MKNALARMDWVLTEKRHRDALIGHAGDPLNLLFVEEEPDPAQDSQVNELQLWAPNTEKLRHWPARVSGFDRLQCLAIGPGVDTHALAEIDAHSIPGSVVALGVFMSGVAARWPATVCLPQVVDLRTDGELRFRHDNFPSLQAVSVFPDRGRNNIEAVVACENLSELQLLSVADRNVFGLAKHLPLRTLGLLGGKIDSLAGIDVLGGLRSLRLHNLRWLSSISAIAELQNLEELEIRHCRQITDIRCLVGLPRLRRLQLVGCGQLGVRSMQSFLNGIPKLEISATD